LLGISKTRCFGLLGGHHQVSSGKPDGTGRQQCRFIVPEAVYKSKRAHEDG